MDRSRYRILAATFDCTLDGIILRVTRDSTIWFSTHIVVVVVVVVVVVIIIIIIIAFLKRPHI